MNSNDSQSESDEGIDDQKIPGIRSELAALDSKAAALLQISSLLLIFVALPLVKEYLGKLYPRVYAAISILLLLACLLLLPIFWFKRFKKKPKDRLVAIRSRLLNAALLIVAFALLGIFSLALHAIVFPAIK